MCPFGTARFEQARAFYDEVLKPLGAKRVMEHPGVVAYGKKFPEFWIHGPFDQGEPSVGNGTHVGFLATSRQQVQAFYDKALECGGTDDGAPGPRPQYGEPYFGCFIRDLDGHKIEASFWDAPIPEG